MGIARSAGSLAYLDFKELAETYVPLHRGALAELQFNALFAMGTQTASLRLLIFLPIE